MPHGGCLGTDKAWADGVKQNLESAISTEDQQGEEVRECDKTRAKTVLPRTLLRQKSSRRDGRSVSIPSSPRCL